MKLKKILFITTLLLSNTVYSQVPKSWKDKFQARQDTLKFKPNFLTNGHSYSFIEGSPILWYTADTSILFQHFTDTVLLKVEGNMVDGKREGLFVYSLLEKNPPYKTVKLYEQPFRNDQLSGVWKTYSLDGRLVMNNTYAEGSPLGLLQKFQSDGKTLLYEIDVRRNDTVVERDFFPSGKLMSETPYLRGKLHGAGRKYYENGVLQDYVEFNRGDMEGTRRYYHDNGQLWVEERYFANRPWEVVANFDKKGKRRNGGTLKDGTGTMIMYNEDDTVREVLTYKNGEEVK